MLAIDRLANLTIRNPFDDYFVRFIKGPRNIDFDYHSMCTGRRGNALQSKDSVRFFITQKRCEIINLYATSVAANIVKY